MKLTVIPRQWDVGGLQRNNLLHSVSWKQLAFGHEFYQPCIVIKRGWFTLFRILMIHGFSIDNYLEHRFGNFSVVTRALLRTFSANDVCSKWLRTYEDPLPCHVYIIQLNIAYLYYIYRWCDVALRYMGSILRYIEIIWLSGWNLAGRDSRQMYIYWANERMDPDALGERLQFEHHGKFLLYEYLIQY